jgi:hypothetical protein
MADGTDTRNPWTRPGVLIAAAFLVVAVVLGIVVLTRTGPATPAATPTVATTTAATTAAAEVPTPTVPATASTASTASSPVAGGGDQELPRTAPPVSWVTVKTLALPVSATAGPRVDTDTVMSGYAHTPIGALIATADTSARYSIVDNWRQATLASVADTPGRAAFLQQRAAYGQVTPTPGQLTQIAGFNIVSYTPGRAVVQLARAAGDGSLTVTTDTVVWRDRDWKLLLPDSGTTPPAADLPSLQGFIPWSST